MRITQNMTYNTYINDIMRRQEALNGLNKQLSTGKKVNAPSDDAVGAATILTSKSLLSSLGQYQRNIESAYTRLNLSEKALAGVKDVLTSIKEIAVLSATGTADAASRANSAVVVSNLYDELVSLGNMEIGGQYLFSGFKTDTPAFSATGAFQGDANKQEVRINASSSISIGVNGGEVFKGTGGGTDIFQTVSDLITALNSDDTAGIEASIGALDASFNQVSGAVADIGGKVKRLQAAEETLTTAHYEVRSIISNLEDADIAEVISELRLGQIALEAALTSAGKVFSTNIFNYI